MGWGWGGGGGIFEDVPLMEFMYLVFIYSHAR